jgi:hypothetical protein
MKMATSSHAFTYVKRHPISGVSQHVNVCGVHYALNWLTEASTVNVALPVLMIT